MTGWCTGPITATLFDLDGVLVESQEAIDWCMRTWAKERSLDPENVVAMSHGRRDLDIVRDSLPGRAPEPELARLAELDLRAVSMVRAVPGARRLLEALPASSWAVVTSGAARIARARLAAARLPLPDLLVSADDVRAGKPDPEGYLLAADKLGASPGDCLVFEDAEVGVLAAQRAGSACIRVGTAPPEEAAGMRPCAAAVGDLTEVRAVPSEDGWTFVGTDGTASRWSGAA